ncbi:thioredoxin family protein [Celerinatantimonas sp. YJH-8]|uniref:protein-disulfide reductase DsbD family protein n=1 Tax=Celerinatantimonas sp. YJH-8 TaxID=3228714 RepID=UPI0038C7AF03
MLKIWFRWLFALAVFGAWPVYGWAMTTGWLSDAQHPEAQVRLSILAPANDQDVNLPALLEVRLAPQWKTYWRTPGEAGAAPEIVLKDSRNVQSVQWFWPLPQRTVALGIETLGYQSFVAFPLQINISDLQQAAILHGQLFLSVCHQLCIQMDFPLDLRFTPSQLFTPPDLERRYQQALVQVPRSDPAEFHIDSVSYSEQKQQITVFATSVLGWNLHPQMFIEQIGHTFNTALVTHRVQGNQLQAIFALRRGDPGWQQRALDITLSNGYGSGQFQVHSMVPSPSAATHMGWIFLCALLGGLILNVMPCVLPVLGIKLASVLLVQGQQRRAVRYQFLASAAGIFISFWAIAGGLLITREYSSVQGWGIQFQSPWFVGILLFLCGLFSLNLLGLWELQLPARWRDFLASRGQQQYWGHFSQGIFATLLATPCSAPFLVTAVTAAMLASPLGLWVIFTGVALGMALPWLFIATFPGCVRYLPKPGFWMVGLRNLFGLMMVMTALWLASVLDSFLPIKWVWGGIVFCLFVMVFRLFKQHRYPLLGGLVGVVAVSALFGIGGSYVLKNQMNKEQIQWQPFSEQRLTQALAAHKTVLVDITADWCMTCQANYLNVFSRKSVIDQLHQHQVVLLKGDWTHSDPRINRYLAQYQRYGVPYNRLYSANAPNGVELPVILTASSFLRYLERIAP